MPRTALTPFAAPSDVPISPGVRKGNIVQVAGQVAFHPETGAVVGSTVAEQTEQTMRNVLAVLAEAGATEADVVMFRVYLTDTAHFAEMNDTYAKFISDPRPARTTVYVGLPEGLLVEIDALAVLD
ncbi:RidA family protein [Actinokineospora globicatena]|uniref:RidA family protein n=1 Tax=Actinokineospora globicatena TaxID=103729 RepID=UPI0020A51336|nr:RidA family protein [Actinokineospora globicatena]MCP2306836.1 reactive intermediate/imine deaminase [Actinokineospora globicatena]GLW82277.1 reactive intermediate/imine deaminase [Actinokineospora globicatena]GLW89130.1 reactive intermediate/imine deaminase [Actinokineospora globicatena]